MFPTLGAHRTTEQNMDWMLSADVVGCGKMLLNQSDLQIHRIQQINNTALATFMFRTTVRQMQDAKFYAREQNKIDMSLPPVRSRAGIAFHLLTR